MAKVKQLRLNGKTHALEVEGDRMLLGVLRDDLDMTGTKYGCGEGQCGACTVLVDGVPTHSCITPVSAVAGKQITTIEGLARNGRLHPLQQAFLDHGAMQCAYCTSGMLMAAAGLLQHDPHPTDEAILDAMQGNICRCGTYPRVVAAIRQASGARNGTSQ